MDEIKKSRVEIVPVKPPLNLINSNDWKYYATTMPIYPIEIFRYRNVYVTNSGICFGRFARLLPGSFMLFKRIKKDQNKIALFNFFFRKRIILNPDRSYLVVHNQWSINGYYHWLIDSMSRLWSMKQEFSNIYLLLPEKAKNITFIQEILSLIPQIRIEYLPEKRVGYVKSLIIPTHLPNWGLLEPSFLKEFREYIINHVSYSGSNFPFIYISRKKANRRKIINEEALFSKLSQLGFHEIILEDYTFQEQVDIFKNAKGVVSIHGAGLSNLIFMNKGTAVFEIIRKPIGNESYIMEYQKLASFFDINYFSFPCEPVNKNQSFDSADLQVDVHKLMSVIVGSISI